MNPKVSFLIPTTGKLELLKISIASLLSQANVPRDAIEIVVANASKSDEVEGIVASFADQRIHYFDVPDRDPSIGWDFAYKQSHGDYVVWFDDDDCALPNTLSVILEVISRTRADVVTAQHLYFYDAAHAREDRTNSMGITYFDGKEYAIDPKEALRTIFNYTIGNKALHFRLRSGSTYFSRAVCEQAIARLGFVVLPHMRTSHSLQTILYPFAKSCVGVSIPTVIVGRLGNSMTQSFRKLQKQQKKSAPQFEYSPVSGDLLSNHIAESYLKVAALLPDLYKDVPFNRLEFLARRYGREIYFSEFSLSKTLALFRELLEVLEKEPEGPERADAIDYVRKRVWRSFIWAPFKALGVYVFAKDVYQRLWKLFSKKGRNPKLGMGEYRLKLAPYGVNDIQTLSLRAREIVLEKVGRDIEAFEPRE